MDVLLVLLAVLDGDGVKTVGVGDFDQEPFDGLVFAIESLEQHGVGLLHFCHRSEPLETFPGHRKLEELALAELYPVDHYRCLSCISCFEAEKVELFYKLEIGIYQTNSLILNQY